jgi:hypothetical protein
MAALFYMIAGAFAGLFLGVPGLFVALSFDSPSPRGLPAAPKTAGSAAPELALVPKEDIVERAAARVRARASRAVDHWTSRSARGWAIAKRSRE